MGYALGSIIGHQRKSAKASPSLTILHCVSAYPAPLEEMNLSVIAYLRRTYGPNVGLSDHTIGKAAALIALGLGARIFEKHLTLDRGQPGPDHNTSFLPMEMRDYVIYLRDGEVALGDGIKRVMPCETETENATRLSSRPAKRKYDADRTTDHMVVAGGYVSFLQRTAA